MRCLRVQSCFFLGGVEAFAAFGFMALVRLSVVLETKMARVMMSELIREAVLDVVSVCLRMDERDVVVGVVFAEGAC